MKKYLFILPLLFLTYTVHAQQIPDLDAIDAVASGDLYYCVDVSDTTDSANGTGKKCTTTQIQTAIDTGATTLTGLTDVNTAGVTAGRILVADGTDYESVAVSGDITMTSAGVVTLAAGAVDYQQVVTVAKSGADYTTIQGAIDSISDNASNKPYSVLIYPGIYTEDIVMEDYVSLYGVGDPVSIIIYGTNSAPLVTGSAENAYEGIFGLTLSLAPTSNAQSLISNSAGTLVVQNSNLFINSSTNDIVATVWAQTGGSCWLNSSYIIYNMDGTHATSKTHSVISVSGTSSYIIRRSEVDIDVDDANDTVIFLNESTNNTIKSDVLGNALHMTLNSASYSGTAGGFYLHGSGTNKFVQNNHFHMESAGNGTAYGFYVNSTTVAATVWSTANQVHVEGFATNYGLNIAAGDTFISHFDDVVADGGNTGAGTITAVQSPSDGNFIATGNATISGTLEGATVTEGGNAVPNSTDSISFLNDVNTATATAGNLLIADGTDWESVSVAGDITISSAGATTIGGNKVQLAELDVSDVSDNIAGDIAEGELADAIIVDADIKDDVIQEPALNAIDSPNDNECLVYNAAGTNFSWETCAAGGATTLTGLTDVNTATASAGRLLIADGTDWESIAMSGDVTIGSAGATTIGANKVQVSELDLSIVPTWTGVHTFTVDIIVPEENYGVGWNGSLEVPTKDDVFDQMQVVSGLTSSAAQNFFYIARPQQAKLPSSNPMGIDAGNENWRGLFDDTTDECGTWDTVLYPYQGGTLQGKVLYSMDNTNGGTTAIEVSFDCKSDGDAMDTPSFQATPNTLTGTVPATLGDLGTLTDTTLTHDSCAQYDHVTMKACRDADGNDTINGFGDFELRGVLIYE